MKILCVGLREAEAGKTTLTLALMRYLKDHGKEVCGFKPRAGNDVWYDWTIVEKALQEGTVYGKDAKLLRDATTKDLPIEIISPGHRLWLPTTSRASPFGGMPFFLLDRITTKEGTTVILNDQVELPLDQDHFTNLLSKSKVQHISKRSDLREITTLYNQADTYAHSQITKKFSHIVYESYADIGLPWQGIKNIDYVFAVKPFHVSVYSGERYLRAYDVLASFPEEEKAERIIENLQATREMEIPPFSEDPVEKLRQYLNSFFDNLFDL